MATTTEIALVPGQRAARRILAVIATGVDLFDRLHEAQEFAGSVIEFGGYGTTA